MPSFNEQYRKPLIELFPKLVELSHTDEADLFDPDQVLDDIARLRQIKRAPVAHFDKNILDDILERYQELLDKPKAKKRDTRKAKKAEKKYFWAELKKRDARIAKKPKEESFWAGIQKRDARRLKKVPCKKALQDFSKCTVASIKQSTSYTSIPRGYKAKGSTKSKLRKQQLVKFIQKYHAKKR